MDTIKERMIGAISIMSEDEVLFWWNSILNSHKTRTSLNDIEETEPTPEEIAIMDAYEAGDPEYQPSISHDDLKKSLGL